MEVEATDLCLCQQTLQHFLAAAQSKRPVAQGIKTTISVQVKKTMILIHIIQLNSNLKQEQTKCNKQHKTQWEQEWTHVDVPGWRDAS